jgi:hypothetical protein
LTHFDALKLQKQITVHAGTWEWSAGSEPLLILLTSKNNASLRQAGWWQTELFHSKISISNLDAG